MSSSSSQREGQPSDSLESETDTSTGLDAPRVAQWIDEEELEDDVPSEAGDQGPTFSPTQLALEQDMSQLPLGALAKAHKTVNALERDAEDAQDEDSDSSLESEVEHNTRHRAASLTPAQARRPVGHRPSKHAPIEVTSKRPVTRRRQVVEDHHVRPRDPRFSDLSGSLSMNKFRSNYGFLPSLHVDELATLKQSLARARKRLTSSPRHLRTQHEEEVTKLELAVKRAESTVNRERREDVERQALGKVQKEEIEKRKAGKKAWFMKAADKKAVRVRARMEAIAASGGKRAVKKAIQKKQRKVGQKEKKGRPFARKDPAARSQKRPRDDGVDRQNTKRPHV